MTTTTDLVQRLHQHPIITPDMVAPSREDMVVGQLKRMRTPSSAADYLGGGSVSR